jgi:Stage II sporulation protein E (SpoIIE)
MTASAGRVARSSAPATAAVPTLPVPRAGPVVRLRPLIRRRSLRLGQLGLLSVLTVVAALYTVAAVYLPSWFPSATATLWLMLGGFFLRLRFLLAYFAIVSVALATSVTMRHEPAPAPGVGVALVVTALLVLAYARSRERVGIQGSLGATMLVDLRDRLLAQGEVPPLDPGWRVESVLRAAHGDSFSGDFLVASRAVPTSLLELALVDVSGKGQPAGTRALMLSGAFGGLLGAMSPTQFLPAANRYLLRQRWDEGFATAVHVAVDQASGAFEVRVAGHPPAAHFHAGSGRWDVLDGDGGPALGILEEPAFPVHSGCLEHGDALLLYTDGLVEARGRDIGLGIDRLIGVAERVATDGFDGGAARILDAARAGDGDDRAVVVMWRS